MKLSLTKTLHFDYPWRLSIVKQSLKKKKRLLQDHLLTATTAKSCFVLEQKTKRFLSSWKKKRVFSWFSLLTKSLEFSFSAEQKLEKKKELWFSLFCQLLSKERPKVLNLSTFILCWKQKLKKKKGFDSLSSVKRMIKSVELSFSVENKNRGKKKVLVLSCVQRTSKTAFCSASVENKS